MYVSPPAIHITDMNSYHLSGFCIAAVVSTSLWWGEAPATAGDCVRPHHVYQRTDMSTQPSAITVFGRDYDIRKYRKESDLFTITAYNLDRISTGKDPGDPGFGITATGTFAKTGRTVAVDPTVIPYGSLLYIEGVGWRIAEDTGGAIRGRHIDVLMPSRRNALQFGVKQCKVTVYIPDNLTDV
ncbi:hypothetical protein Alches_01440 [Alicyclobacillus hesperidum subsp. aegles]|nr:hypothetical protein Alches_01440 [Alicyclobacillus hesperidum subsp. aegles]